jgi:hypothetical protein
MLDSIIGFINDAADGAERGRKLVMMILMLGIGIILFEAKTGYFGEKQLQLRIENAAKLVEAAQNANTVNPDVGKRLLEAAEPALSKVLSALLEAETRSDSTRQRLWSLARPLVAGLGFWFVVGLLLISMGHAADKTKRRSVVEDHAVLYGFAWLGLLAGFAGMVFEPRTNWAIWFTHPLVGGLAACAMLFLIGTLLGPKSTKKQERQHG